MSLETLNTSHRAANPAVVMQGGWARLLVRRLAAEDTVFRKDIFDEKNQMIETDIILILNERIINPYERSTTILQEGDEVTFVSMLYGG